MGNLVLNFNITETYVNKDDLWLNVLAAAAFKILSATNRLTGSSPGKLVYGHDDIILIKIRWIGN